MKRTYLTLALLIAAIGSLMAQEPYPTVFEKAKWIALEPDSTILFPYTHLPNEKSAEARSLKKYVLPVLRKSFSIRKKVKAATANICGLGQYELHINGIKVGDYFLDPGWTMYNKQLLYNTFDITDLLNKAKKNPIDISVTLGGGMYDITTEGYHKMAGSCGAPKLLMAIVVKYADGSSETINSDESWTAEPSKIRYSSIYAGETYDATYASECVPVVITKPHWDAALRQQDDNTRLKIKTELDAVAMPGTNIYDSGQNCSGIVRIKVKGKRGQAINIHPAEILKDGKIYQKCMPGYTWKYILRGDADGEQWQPQFSYTGFRYLEIQADEGVSIEKVSVLHTTTNLPETGTFECSDTLFNQIYTLIDWAIRSNLASITTDCPTREKLGWQEQNHLMAHSLMYRYDMHALMNKIADDMADSQHENGAIPTIAPEYVIFVKNSGFEDTPEWGASFILCPYYTYKWYGDDTAIRKHYEAMKRYVEYLDSRTDGHILNYGLGDWYDIGPNRPGRAQLTSVALSATAMYHYELTIMNDIATMLGKTDDAEQYAQKAKEVKQSFNQRFWNADTLCYEKGSQTASAMALFMGLTTEATHQQTVDALVNNIRQRMNGQEAIVTAGDVGYRYVLQSLFQSEKHETVWEMNRRNDIPGYAYQLRQGATALTESWQAYDDASNNHFMLGHLMEWLFEAPGGIRQAKGSTGWQHIVIAPQMVGNLTWAKTSVNTPKGIVRCHWKADSSRTRWAISCTIPDGAEADILLPDGRVEHVQHGKYKFKSRRIH